MLNILIWQYCKEIPALNGNGNNVMMELMLLIHLILKQKWQVRQLLPQLKSAFKRTISWNKYVPKPKLLARNRKLNHLIEPSFQGVNTLFVLAFENDAQRTSNKNFCIPNVEIKDYNVMIDGKNFFDQPIKNNKVTYENIRKIAESIKKCVYW